MLATETIITLCRDLIGTPSVNGIHPERAVAEVAADFARNHGLVVELPALDAERPNLVVRTGAGEVGLLLIAHLDTVATGDPASWAHPPFAGEIAHGRLYGRGAIDTKGGLAAALAAMVTLAEQNLQSSVLLVGVPDEEAGATGTLGVKYLHQIGLLRGRGAIYVYPGSDELVIGHRGVLRLCIRTYGRAMHTGSREWQDAPIGQNALAGMIAILHAIEQLRFADTMPGTLFAPFRTVITPATISGGSGPSMVPALCEARIDIRLVPVITAEIVQQAIQQVIDRAILQRPGLQADVTVEARIPATQIDPNEPIVLAVQEAAHTLLGRNPQPSISGPANESYLLNGFGIPTCIIGPDGANAHAVDEYVEIDSLVRLAEVYARVAQRL
jgi:succinyl-diaminopimelate desuccinylase